MKIEELIKKYLSWFKTDTNSVEQLRLANKEKGREWCYKALGYDKNLTLKDYQTFFNRKEQNDEYVKRHNVKDIPSKKPHAWYQTDINMIYSFHKCFAMRNATRLQYYRNDLSQKGKRTSTAVNQAIGKYQVMRDNAEKEPQ